MLIPGLSLLVLVGFLLAERWYSHRLRKTSEERVTPEEREAELDALRRKLSAEMKERKHE